MMKTSHLVAAVAAILLTGPALADESGLGQRVEDRLADRLDRRGDRIDHRLDRRGDRIDRRLDRRGKRVHRRIDRHRPPNVHRQARQRNLTTNRGGFRGGMRGGRR